MNNPFDILDQRLRNIECLLLDLKHNPHPNGSPQAEGDKLLTIQEAGELLNLAIPTLYSMVSRREIPCSKRGKRLYFSKKELMEWVKAGRKKTLSEIEEEAAVFIANQKKRG